LQIPFHYRLFVDDLRMRVQYHIVGVRNYVGRVTVTRLTRWDLTHNNSVSLQFTVRRSDLCGTRRCVEKVADYRLSIDIVNCRKKRGALPVSSINITTWILFRHGRPTAHRKGWVNGQAIEELINFLQPHSNRKNPGFFKLKAPGKSHQIFIR